MGYLRHIFICFAVLSLLCHPQTSWGQETDNPEWEQESVNLVQQYLQINTVNPPGNESRAVAFFARIFEAEGIPFETAESAPGRGNIWARLDGGDEPALILLHHSDVVPADDESWDSDPLSGEIRDEHIYGRGALDMKATGILQLQTFLALHRSGVPLKRDVIFMATADEEAGGFYGAGWLIENRPELFEGVGYLINEGGSGTLTDGKVRFSVEVTQKVPLWLRIVSMGEPGHGSVPRTESAVTRLIGALARIHAYPSAHRITPPVDAYFKAIAGDAGPEWQESFQDMETAIRDPEFVAKLHEQERSLHSLTRNTISMTMLEGSSKINVVPNRAAAELDCRLLPDQDPEEFINTLRFIINDPAVTIEKIMGFTPAISSTDTDLYRAIEGVFNRHFPEAPVIPSVSNGFTDSHFFRDIGIVCYGVSPMIIPAEDGNGFHGNNERISIENVKRGTRLMLEIIQSVCIDKI